MSGYSISRLAKLLGISSQAIRNYEKYGLIHINRGENRYRNFVAPDMTLLLYIRLYRNLGFSLEDIVNILHMQDNSVFEVFDKKANALTQEIQHLQWQLNRIEKQKADIAASVDNRYKIETVICPAYRGVLFRENRSIKEDYLQGFPLEEIVGKMPDNRQIMYIPHKSIDNGSYSYFVGLSIDDEKSFNTLRKMGGHCFDVPPSVCLTCTANIVFSNNTPMLSGPANFLKHTFEEIGIQEYMQRNGLSLAGDILAQGIHHIITDEYKSYVWKFYFPVFTENVVAGSSLK